jgi:PIN domain nuclease of toxin-antitoxin system
MTFLLDTHILLSILRGTLGVDYKPIASRLSSGQADLAISHVSLWEIMIKTRLGKLKLPMPAASIPAFARENDITVLPILEAHILHAAMPEPPTNDPFDRLLLAQSQVERMAFVTVDRALTAHPLALKI